MKTSVLRCAVLATATAATFAVSTPAFAATQTIKDVRSDVWSLPQSSEQPDAKKVGSRKNVDLVRTTVEHSTETVSVSAKYRNLEKNADFFSLGVTMRTSLTVSTKRHDDVGVTVWAGPENRKGQFLLWAGDHEVACEGLTHAIDYEADTISLSIPRGCMGDPEFVKAQITASAMHETKHSFAVLADFVGTKKDHPGPWSKKLYVD